MKQNLRIKGDFFEFFKMSPNAPETHIKLFKTTLYAFWKLYMRFGCIWRCFKKLEKKTKKTFFRRFCLDKKNAQKPTTPKIGQRSSALAQNRPSGERRGDADGTCGGSAGGLYPRGDGWRPPRSKEAAPDLCSLLLGNNQARLSGLARKARSYLQNSYPTAPCPSRALGHGRDSDLVL